MLQKESKHDAVRKEGCCFLCCCYKGGLDNIDEADNCFTWALKKGLVRDDSYVNINKDNFASKIAQMYNRKERSGTIVKGNNHFYVIDGNRNEIYNSVRPNYGH